MKLFVFLFLLVNGASAVTHTLKYFYTASSGVPNFPEYVSVGLVDDAQISHCDSISNKNVPKQDWMNKAKEDDPQYWDRQTQICLGHQQAYKANIDIAKKRFNQTGGTHIFQYMYGCGWDDQTGEVTGYRQLGYDGEDLLVWNMETGKWIAANQQAVVTQQKWDSDKAQLEYFMSYTKQICPEWLKKYVGYAKSSLPRTALPSVSLLQKTPSSPVSCHATGFYPDRAMMFWRKDGEEIHEGVEHGEILRNHDESFQMNIDLKISSVSPEDWRRYDCVFQLSGVNDDIITKLDKAEIRSNEGSENSTVMIITIIAVVVVAVVVAVIGFIVYKKKTEKKLPSPAESGEVQMMMPQA